MDFKDFMDFKDLIVFIIFTNLILLRLEARRGWPVRENKCGTG